MGFAEEAREKGLTEETIDKLKSEGLDRVDDLLEIGEDDIKKMGFNLGQRNRLKKWIAELAEANKKAIAQLASKKEKEKPLTVPKLSHQVQKMSIKEIEEKNDAALLSVVKANNTDMTHLNNTAPLSVLFLGKLVLVSAYQVDFSLAKHKPKEFDSKRINGFKLLRYPNSFRACLVQISNDGWYAFKEAHTTMHNIYLNAGNLQTHINTCIKIIEKGTIGQIQQWIPDPVEQIKIIAKDCVSRCDKTVEMFEEVLAVIVALNEACEDKRKGAEDELREMKTAKQTAELMKKEREKDIKQSEETYEMYTKKTFQAEEDVKKALKSGPGTVKKVFLSVLDGLATPFFLVARDKKSLRESATDDHRYEVEKQQEALKRIEEKRKEEQEKMEKSRRELISAMEDLGKIDIKTADVKEIQKVLQKGVLALGDVSAQWRNMSVFFKEISTNINTGLKHSTDDFARELKKCQDKESIEAAKFLILDKAVTASIACQLAQKHSHVYFEVSKQFLMPELANIGVLSALNAKENEAEIDNKMDEIKKKCDNLPQEIAAITGKIEEGFQLALPMVPIEE